MLPTEASSKLGLDKESYLFRLTSQSIVLLDKNGGASLITWSLGYIRGFHVRRKDHVVMFEAGRRCDTGPGTFQFSVDKHFNKLLAKLEDLTGIIFSNKTEWLSKHCKFDVLIESWYFLIHLVWFVLGIAEFQEWEWVTKVLHRNI